MDDDPETVSSKYRDSRYCICSFVSIRFSTNLVVRSGPNTPIHVRGSNGPTDPAAEELIHSPRRINLLKVSTYQIIALLLLHTEEVDIFQSTNHGPLDHCIVIN